MTQSSVLFGELLEARMWHAVDLQNNALGKPAEKIILRKPKECATIYCRLFYSFISYWIVG